MPTTSPEQSGSDPLCPVTSLYEGWVSWYQDMVSIYAQMVDAQWRLTNTLLDTFRPWIEPGAMIEQMLGVEPHKITPEPPGDAKPSRR